MTVTLEHINKKLKNASPEILESVLFYVESLINPSNFVLTENIKNQLTEIANRPISNHQTEDQLDNEIKKKYGFSNFDF